MFKYNLIAANEYNHVGGSWEPGSCLIQSYSFKLSFDNENNRYTVFVRRCLGLKSITAKLKMTLTVKCHSDV